MVLTALKYYVFRQILSHQWIESAADNTNFWYIHEKNTPWLFIKLIDILIFASSLHNTQNYMHKKVWQLAAPIILANMTVPLLGAVDIAVVGHLPGPQFMAAVGIGATIFSALYFGFVFLRMGTTGLVAIAYGGDNHHESTAWLIRSILIAIILGLLLIIAKPIISNICFYFIHPEGESLALAQQYFSIRIFSAPAALCNFALLGWMIGQHKTKQALYTQLILNITNIILDIYFVVNLKLGVPGAAYATVIAEYIGLGYGLFLSYQAIKLYFSQVAIAELLRIDKLKKLASINNNIFIRSLCLQMALFYFTMTGATFGDTVLAVNAVLINFQLFMAYGLDGFANAAEALVGESIGKRQHKNFIKTLKVTALWSVLFAIIFTLVYALFWHPIVLLLTNVNTVILLAQQYIAWLILLPLLSVWSFWLDGVFIGATQTKPMRNSMIVSLIIFVALCLTLTPTWGNHGLWCAFSVFMLIRAITLGSALPRLIHKF